MEDLRSKLTDRWLDDADGSGHQAAKELGKRVVAKGRHYTAQAASRLRPGLSRQADALPAFDPGAHPKVSVVIPVYQHWDETLRCLVSLEQTYAPFGYEVIVVDDASGDGTADRLEDIGGLKIIRHESNTGFVGACNSGIAAARGEYVALLNNDTEVTPYWLQALVDCLADPSIGLVGSRLVYPDGTLQEAGAHIFSDGSGWNYGRGQNPENHSFTYRRDVDYCSGASILVRKSILDELGGLDTRFMPAYYEDTDLAFSTRKLGYRVVYEPRSLVVHHEGVSHGTDVTSGVKAHQEINRVKFVEKWKEELALQPASPTDDPDFEIERIVHSDNIVFVFDWQVPTPDLDSGSLRMSQIILALKELGYQVIVVPKHPDRIEPWTGWFGERGIQVLYRTAGPHGWDDISPTYLAALLGDAIKFTILSRVAVASEYLLPMSSIVPSAMSIFDTVDLHGLRELRKAELEGDPVAIRAARRTEAIEAGVMRAADHTFVVSPVEQALLAERYPDVPVSVLGNVHQPVEHRHGPAGREGLAFIGSFQHEPNIDGIEWYLREIDPLVRRALPDIEVRIYGRDAPAWLRDMASEHVKFEGYVADLADVYDRARVAIAPLRYGAGVKGKVGEALSWGLPMVTTSIGAEGMDLVDGVTARIADDAEGFARAIVELVGDDRQWQGISTAGEAHIDSIFGPAAMRRALAPFFPRVN
ncbi:MAG: glycosyltransferase [Actinomycetaceae bacterium]|nr:glycosyltransferase [Actinomycetaceae bacterium]